MAPRLHFCFFMLKMAKTGNTLTKSGAYAEAKPLTRAQAVDVPIATFLKENGACMMESSYLTPSLRNVHSKIKLIYPVNTVMRYTNLDSILHSRSLSKV